MIEPKLRFKKDDGSDFPDWEEKKLGDVCDTLTYGMNAAAVKFDGENKYIRITDIDDESHCYKNDELVSPDGELDNKYLVCENDILLARTGASVGKSYLYNKEDGKLYYAGFLIKAHVKSENSKFIFFQTLTERYDKWVKITSMRSGQPGINANEYSDFTMNVPSLPEQQKIADFLSTIDTIIEKQRAMISAWEERKKGVMQKLFSQEVRFKADDGSDLPDWEEKKIEELIQLYDEKVASGCELPVLTSSKKNGIEYQEEHFAGKQRHDIDGYNVLPRNYCTYRNRSDGTDFTFNINRLCDKGIVSKFYPVFKENNCDLFFLVSLLNNEPQAVRKIAYTAKGTGQKVLSIIDLKSIMIMMPSLPEQQKIADCLSALDTVIEKQKETLEKWQELKKGLLQQMFV